MTVQKYLKKHNLSTNQLAERCGESRQRIQYHINHKTQRWPTDLAEKIQIATRGEIMAYDLAFGRIATNGANPK